MSSHLALSKYLFIKPRRDKIFLYLSFAQQDVTQQTPLREQESILQRQQQKCTKKNGGTTHTPFLPILTYKKHTSYTHCGEGLIPGHYP